MPFIRLHSNEPIDAQILLIVGNTDPSVSLESIIQSSEHTSRSNIKVISGTQHFPHQEKPDIVNEVIIKFLNGRTYFFRFFWFILRSKKKKKRPKCSIKYNFSRSTIHIYIITGSEKPSIEKSSPKGIVSTWLGSLSSTVKYGNQVFDAVHKRTNSVVSSLPNKALYLGQTTV